MTIFDDASGILTANFEAFKGVSVSYHFAGGSTIVVTAWEGRTAGAAPTGIHDRDSHYVDWIMDKTELTVSDVQQEPTRGDTMTYDGSIYEVLPLADGEPAWDLSGIDRGWFRIHTKKQT